MLHNIWFWIYITSYNYIKYNDRYRQNIQLDNPLITITRTRVLDELYGNDLISKEYHRFQRSKLLELDKIDELRDLIQSMSFAAFVMTFVIFYFYPHNDYVLFKTFYFIYLFIIYILCILLYRGKLFGKKLN